MSIAYEINRLKLNKQKVKEQVNVDKDIINEGREFIRGETVRHYPSGIKSMEMSYKDFIPVHTSTESLIETERGGTIISKTLKGNTSQNGTPTPDAPVNIDVVTGENTINIVGRNVLKINDATNIGSYLNYNIQDGVIRITGTANNTYSACTLTNLINIAELNKIPNGTKLTFSVLDIEGLSASQIFIGKAGNNYWMQPNATTKKVTVTKNADITSMSIWFSTTQGQVYDITIKPMLVIGETAYDYEPYQRKDYEINLGKNLLQYSDFTNRTESGITITNNNDGTFLVNGTATADISLAVDSVNFIPMKGTWKMVGCPSGGSSSTYMLSAYVGYWGGGSPNIDTGNGTSITYTGNVKVRFYIKSGTTCNNLLFKPMITYDLNATYEDFSPYFTPIELCKIGDYQDFIRKGTGKNLYGNAIKTDNMITSTNTIVEDTSDKLEIQGVSQYYSGIYKKYQLNPNTQYTISTYYSDLSNSAKGVIYYKLGDECEQVATNNRDDYKVIETTRTSLSFITDSTGLVAILFCCNWTANNGHIVYNDIQLEKGTATYYEPYGYKDKWYIEKNVGKVVFTGVTGEGWVLQGINNYNIANFNTYRTEFAKGVVNQSYNNRFTPQTTLIANEQNPGYYLNHNQTLFIRINSSVASTVEAFRTWLSSNNMIVYYVKEIPTYTLIESEELIEQLEEIIPLLEGQNNISVSGNLPTGIDVDYIERVNKHLIGNTNESAE